MANLASHVATLGETRFAKEAANGIALGNLREFKSISGNTPSTVATHRANAKAVHKGSLADLPELEAALINLVNHAYEVRGRKEQQDGLHFETWRQLFREAVGERKTDDGRTFGGIASHRGGHVLLPVDVDQSQFSELIGALEPADFGDDGPMTDAGPATRRDIQNARLVTIGYGKYALNVGDDADRRFLKTAKGSTFVLDLVEKKEILKSRVPLAYLEGR